MHNVDFQANLALWPLLILGLLVLAGIAMLVLWLQTRERSYGQTARSVIVALLWSLPVLTAMGLVVARAMPLLQADEAVARDLNGDPRLDTFELHGRVDLNGRRQPARITLFAYDGDSVEPVVETHTDLQGKFDVRAPLHWSSRGTIDRMRVWTEDGPLLSKADLQFRCEGLMPGKLWSDQDGVWVMFAAPSVEDRGVNYIHKEHASAELVAPALPDEVRQWSQTESDRTLIVSSGEYPTVWDAQQDAERRARAAILADVYGENPDAEQFAALTAAALEQAILRRHHETVEHQTDRHTFTMHRVHLQVAATDEVRHELYQSWRTAIRDRRLWTLGGLGGMAVLIVGTCATYLRLDRATRGRHRRKLKLAAVALLTAAGLVIAGVLPMA